MGAVILEDTRQQAGKHAAKHAWWEEAGVSLVRTKLHAGDYCLPPARAVDTKASIAELAACIDAGHARFRRELVAARDAGTELYVLTENDFGVRDLAGLARWVEPLDDWRRRVHAARRLEGERLAKACATMAERYGARFLFCASEDSARIVTEILLGGFDGSAR